MSRCKSCDAPLYKRDTPSLNRFTHEEEDLCISCRMAARYTEDDHEYTCGNNPKEGVTPPTTSYD